MMRVVAFVVLATLLTARIARADDVSEAKNYFKAGASAYAAGDYLAAIQALDAAYRLTPLPAIAFSLAQAERRQYFVARQPTHLLRAIELYRKYLQEVPSGGRRADATDALSQLEPLAIAVTGDDSSGIGVAKAPEKTRLMVTSEAPGARVSLDGRPAKPAPLIAEVTAGPHSIRVEAKGFFASDRRVVAIAGALVPLDVELRERPAVVLLEPSVEADLYVDGRFFGRVRKGTRIELTSGSRELAFARDGRSLEKQVLLLERGETRRLPVELDWTAQRMTAVSLMVVSGVTLVGGLAFTGLAVAREDEADRLLARLEEEPLSPGELSDYEDAREERDRYSAIAVLSYAASAASLVSGVLLYTLDEPNLRDARPRERPLPPKPGVRAAVVPLPGGLAASARLSF